MTASDCIKNDTTAHEAFTKITKEAALCMSVFQQDMKLYMAQIVDLEINFTNSKLTTNFVDAITKLATSFCIYNTQFVSALEQH